MRNPSIKNRPAEYRARYDRKIWPGIWLRRIKTIEKAKTSRFQTDSYKKVEVVILSVNEHLILDEIRKAADVFQCYRATVSLLVHEVAPPPYGLA